MGRAIDIQGLQTIKAPDTMIDMDHQIALGQTGCFAQEIFCPARASAGPHHPLAQNVLFADDRKFRGLKARLQPQHGQPKGTLRHFFNIIGR